MAYQDNSTTYAFGQMGSIIAEANAVLTSNGVEANAVFCAITFLEDCTFTLLTAATSGKFPDSAAVNSYIDLQGVTTANITFSAGTTIYGKWTAITLNTGKAIAYIGY